MKYFLEVILQSYVTEIAFRLLLAALFGALIGLEREHKRRPAGFRTHVLVCVGSCLTMLTSEYIYYHFDGSGDVARLGAQVISGIGFLGAGTIIRNGSSVKGLTTAASLWTVACIGLAVGIGYYAGAALVTVIIFLILAYFKSFASYAYDYTINQEILISIDYSSELINAIKDKFSKNNIDINNIKFSSDKENITSIILYLSITQSTNLVAIIQEIYEMSGVHSISQKNQE